MQETLTKHQRWLNGEEGGVRADLHGANLSDTDLHGANLRWADLRWADLCWADLCVADLCGADLYGANLRGADLYGADLRGADLRGADLYGADLRGADLPDSFHILQLGPIGSRQDYLIATVIDGTLTITTGCFTGTLEQFAAAVAKKHGENRHAKDYNAAIKMIGEWYDNRKS
jgi:uncharacterized protein YjbI with pentapeptide repeats